MIDIDKIKKRAKELGFKKTKTDPTELVREPFVIRFFPPGAIGGIKIEWRSSITERYHKWSNSIDFIGPKGRWLNIKKVTQKEYLIYLKLKKLQKDLLGV